jgi:hypothetical protein
MLLKALDPPAGQDATTTTPTADDRVGLLCAVLRRTAEEHITAETVEAGALLLSRSRGAPSRESMV